MNKLRQIVLLVGAVLLLAGCQRRPIEAEYLRVYLDLTIDREVINYKVGEKEPGLMRVVFFDQFTGEYLSHDFVSDEGGYIFAPYGNVDMVVYNVESGNTHIRNYYSYTGIEAYTDEATPQQRGVFSRYLQSREESSPSYAKICVTPGHLFVARKQGITIPRHISQEAFVIQATAKTVVESWTVTLDNVSGLQWVGAVSMMISGQSATSFIATDTPSTESIALYFDAATASRENSTLSSRFETFGREFSSGDPALLSVLFTDVQGHPYLYNFNVSSQMEDNPEQHIHISYPVDIPKPTDGGGFRPEVDDWNEFIYDVII